MRAGTRRRSLRLSSNRKEPFTARLVASIIVLMSSCIFQVCCVVFEPRQGLAQQGDEEIAVSRDTRQGELSQRMLPGQ